MKKTNKTSRRWLRWTLWTVSILTLAIVGLSIYGNIMMAKVPGLSFDEALDYTLNDSENGIITVGIIQNGQATYTVYGKNAQILPNVAYTYEVGSLTKTLTATLIARAVLEGKISLEDTIDQYLDLPDGTIYPTIEALLTHTSGYKSTYFETPMIGNFFHGRNDYYGVTKDQVMHRIESIRLKNKVYEFQYSNFGYATLGLVLEAVYGEDYTKLVNDFVQNDLGMEHTRIADQSGDLDHYWDWQSHDAYLPAGALLSTMDDMLKYAEFQLENQSYFALTHEQLKTIDATSKKNAMMDIRMDAIGMAWIIDEEHQIIWHNGATGHFNSYLGFDPERGIAVVILSNLSPNERIPATVLGVKWMEEMRQ